MTAGTLVHQLSRNTPGKIDIIVESVLVALMFTTYGLRIWSRRIQKQSFQLNDWIITVAVPLMFARYCLETAVIARCGVGLHTKEVIEIGGPEIIPLTQKLVYPIDLLWVTLVSMVKLSILHFYIQVFRSRTFIRAAYVVIGLTVAFWFGAFFGTAFFCNPPNKQWDPKVPGHCGDSNALYTSCASTDLVLDVITIMLPMPVLWGLQLPKGKKIALTFVFGLGFLIIGITCARIKFMLVLDPTDPLYSLSTMALFSAMVPLLGIINANLPVCAPVIRRIFGANSLDTTRKSTNTAATTVTSRSRHFERLEEPELPLKNMTGNETYASHHDQIRVTTEWEVHLTNSSDDEGYSQKRRDGEAAAKYV